MQKPSPAHEPNRCLSLTNPRTYKSSNPMAKYGRSWSETFAAVGESKRHTSLDGRLAIVAHHTPLPPFESYFCSASDYIASSDKNKMTPGNKNLGFLCMQTYS